MVGKTPRIRKNDRDRFEAIKQYCGCLACILTGHLDVHTSIEHITESGRRIGKDSSQHEATVGLCMWHHFGVCSGCRSTQSQTGEFGPSLAHGRYAFEEFFGDELKVLKPVQDFLLQLFADEPWPEYNISGKAVRLTRQKWIALNHANAPSFSRPAKPSS